MKTVFLIASVIFAVLTVTQTLNFEKKVCAETECKSVEELKCKGGFQKEKFGCSNVCNRMEGQKCGGLKERRCDPGLVCCLKSQRLKHGTGVLSVYTKCVHEN